MKGEVRYDDAGLPVCELCGRSFSRLLTHVVQAHGVTAAQYKKRFGLHSTKGVCSRKSAEKSRLNYLRHIETHKANLDKGIPKRFKPGDVARPKSKYTAQSGLEQTGRLYWRMVLDPGFMERLVESGRVLGMSGAGVRARWKKRKRKRKGT